MDSNGTIYVAANNSVRAFSKSSGRVVSVTVDHPGSKYYKYWGDNEFYLEFAGGGGSGTSAYAMMEENSSISSNYNKFVSSVVVTNGGSGYQSEPNATMRSDAPHDTGDGGTDANFTAVLGTAWGQDWSTGGFPICTSNRNQSELRRSVRCRFRKS